MLGAVLPTYSTIIMTTSTEIDLLLNNFVYSGYMALSGALRAPLAAITGIFIAIFGYSIMMGWISMRMGNFVKAVIKIGLVYMTVTNWGWVSKYFVGFINDAISTLGAALLSGSPVHIPSLTGGINGAMQEVLIQFTKIGSVIFNTGGWRNIGGWFDGIIIWGFGYLTVGLGLFEIILSKVMLSVLFIFTPLIVLFSYFKPLQSVFDRWLGAIIGFALLQLFVTASLTLALSLSYWWAASYVVKSALQIGNFGTLPVVIIGIICIGLILKAAQLAQNLGGSVSTSSASAMVGAMVGGAIGSSMGAARMVTSPFSGIRNAMSSGSQSASSLSSSSNASGSSIRSSHGESASAKFTESQQSSRSGE